jgi:predicted lipoprotein with Yx(FWY)xxD motif
MPGGWLCAAGLAAFSIVCFGRSASSGLNEREDYEHVPMPPGFQVVSTELEGTVFADAHGHTLYKWPRQGLRNGDAGDEKGTKSHCNEQVTRVTSGLQSPYPAGLLLPDLDTRPSCAQVWPPVLASAKDKPLGKWSIIPRENGTKQWAYDGSPVYTSMLDRERGDTYGGTKRFAQADSPAVRIPVGPPPNVPPELAVVEVAAGRLLTTFEGYSAYAWDNDEPKKSHCDAACTKQWAPILAPQDAQPRGEWTLIERSPGIRQWVFRGKPLYRRLADHHFHSLEGSDEPGWHNVYTQRPPAPPKGFTVRDTRVGQVLADASGRTLYVYVCGDDSFDQLSCDHPDMTQAMRLAICGGGSAERCLKTWPYVIAPKNARSDNRVWTTIDIDPMTGHRAAPGQKNALHVWAFRDRPVYTFADDKKPGDINGDAWGEFNGWRDGFKAFWLRDDFFYNAG